MVRCSPPKLRLKVPTALAGSALYHIHTSIFKSPDTIAYAKNPIAYGGTAKEVSARRVRYGQGHRSAAYHNVVRWSRLAATESLQKVAS